MDPNVLEKFMKKDHLRISWIILHQETITTSFMDNGRCHRPCPSHYRYPAVPI